MEAISWLASLLCAIVVVALCSLRSARHQRSSRSYSPSHQNGNSSRKPSSNTYAGRPLVDPVLRDRHGLKDGEVRTYSRKEIALHNTEKDLWLVVDRKVYDVTDYVDEHPGGCEAILKRPGQDNTEGFFGPQHPEKAAQLIDEYFLGHAAKELLQT